MSSNAIRNLLNSVTVGEVGEKNVEIRNSITNFSYDLSADLVSEIRFTVADPYFYMHNNNYFMVGRTVTFLSEDLKFEIAAIAVRHATSDTCEVTARLQATQRMRRDKGQYNFGNISPSVFAANMAAKFGLRIFAEDSPANGAIVRESTDNKDESTFDVLQRLAKDLDFRFFEANGTLYFASQDFIVKNQDSFEVTIPSNNTDPFYVTNLSTRRTTDGKSAVTAQMQLIQNDSSLTIYPGASFKILGLSNFTGTFMVDKVGFVAGPSALVSVSGTDVTDPEDMTCSLQSFSQGARGECVKRIQQAVGTKVDGWWGPITQRAVRQFQTKYGLPVDGIIDSDDWNAILEL
jgi:SH3-like domain-containing protein